MRRLLIVVEKACSNFSAYSPDLPGCVATGATPEETQASMKAAIDMHVRGLREDRLPIPEPSATAAYVDGRLHRFTVAARHTADGKVVASGEVTRVIVDTERFLARTARGS